MSEATAVYCDGPRCDTHQGPAPRTLPFPGWLRVIDHGPTQPIAFDFCGWECAIQFGAGLEPPTSTPIEIGDLL